MAAAYGGSFRYNGNTRKVTSGAHTVTVRVTDNTGNVTTRSVTVNK